MNILDKLITVASEGMVALKNRMGKPHVDPYGFLVHSLHFK